MIRPNILREADEVYELGAAKKEGRRRPNGFLQDLLREYLGRAGLPAHQRTDPVSWEPGRCAAIAKEFDRLPFEDSSELVRDAYRALAGEVQAQYDLAAREIEIVPYGDGDPVPYRDSKDMMDDVRENRHLFVYSGGEDHAILSRDETFMFRAVHDLFGHAAWGYTFGPVGEENAWAEHQKAFTPLARAALTTETRGQNSWVNCGPHANLPVAERPYAEQKAALLPERLWTHPAVEEAYARYPEFIRL